MFKTYKFSDHSGVIFTCSTEHGISDAAFIFGDEYLLHGLENLILLQESEKIGFLKIPESKEFQFFVYEA